MKQFTFIVSSLFVLLVTSSCKKQNTIAPAENTSPKVSKIEVVGSTWVTDFSYNAQGRLSEAKDNSFTMKYDYTSGTPVITAYNTATGIKDYTISELVLNGGNKVLQSKFQYYNDQGQVSATQPVSFEYDANGFQVKKTYPGSIYNTEVTNGNMTKLTVLNESTGAVKYTVTYQFYTDKPDKFNLNIFEQGWYDNYMNDNALMGTKNTHLLKKVTTQYTNNTRTTDFTYKTNANGLVTEYTESLSINGAAPVATVYKVSYR